MSQIPLMIVRSLCTVTYFVVECVVTFFIMKTESGFLPELLYFGTLNPSFMLHGDCLVVLLMRPSD